MTTQDSRAIIDANAALLERFVRMYLLDNGIGVQLIETVTRELFGQVVDGGAIVSESIASTPRELVSAAIQDIVEVGLFEGASYDLETLLEGAASLEFLVRYARLVNPAVFPPEVIPSDEIVSAALTIFHEARQTVPTT